MLRKLRARITYANVVATLALFVAVGTGGAYAANTVFSTDIVDGEVKSVDIGNGEVNSADVKDQSLTTFDVSTFLGADIVDGTLTGADIQNGSLNALDIANGGVDTLNIADNDVRSQDITNLNLNDEDVGQDTFVDFTGTIGTVPAQGCVNKLVAGVNSFNDHLLLTPARDAAPQLSYTPIYFNDGTMDIRACNPTTAAIDDGTTHFNLLVFDAN
jgi:hypothetical protein